MALLGCIADDLTGATDLANNLVRAGMRVVQTFGVPASGDPIDADALVVALKSRTIPAPEAAALSLAACRWLRRQGARQIYFKYCSTFDSTPQGNIGPVTEALMEELGCDFAIAAPAFPDAGRTVYQGHLFVGDALLSESPMRNHPLTPMTDANLVRWLQRQLDPVRGRRVGLVPLACIADSPEAIRHRVAELRASGVSLALADTVNNADLLRLGAALHDAPLVTAGSGLALGLPPHWGFAPTGSAGRLPIASGRRAIVAGSCSAATLAQVRTFLASGGNAYQVTPEACIARHAATVAAALAWADACWPRDAAVPLLVYSSAEPASVAAAQQQYGVEPAGAAIESTLAAIALGLVERGARQLILAGGETAGACAHALGITQLQIGLQIDPGVPWCYAAHSTNGNSLHIAFKSGNFGAADFFTRAFTLLSREP